MRLQGKVALITASGSGMGQATALLFASEGSKVVVADNDISKGQETVDLIKKAGGEASFVQTDVTKLTDLKRMVELTVETYGKLNILFNHAGMMGPVGIEGVSEKEWEDAIKINLTSGFFATQYAAPEIKQNGGGSIIFTSSVSGLIGSPGSPAYGAAKGGVISIVRALALHLAPSNIRVNAICPGPTDTPMLYFFLRKPDDMEAARQKAMSIVPLARLGKPDDVASAALFLASDESSYITGVALPVDGGLTIS